ncbi:hypothetical protein QBC32DRAFT_214725, partial [Pseudoneurospora amorphoporcata]
KVRQGAPSGSSAHVVMVGGAHSDRQTHQGPETGTPSPAGFNSLTVCWPRRTTIYPSSSFSSFPFT